jgi:hypothetical protein
VVSRCGTGGTEVAVAVEFDSREAVQAAPCRIAVHARTGGGSRVAAEIRALAPEVVLAEAWSRSRVRVSRCGLGGGEVAVLSSSIREKRSRPHPVASPFTPELVVEAEWLMSQWGRAGGGPLCGGLQSESRGGEAVWYWRHRSRGGCRAQFERSVPGRGPSRRSRSNWW